MLLSTTVQPPIVSLFSSSSSDPLELFTVAKDEKSSGASQVLLVKDAPERQSSPSATIIPLPSVGSSIENGYGYSLFQTVLHIQSPNPRSTFIHSRGELGVRHHWLHIQVRNLGRVWSFEVGVVDHLKRRGILRFSTFQVRRVSFSDSGTGSRIILPKRFRFFIDALQTSPRLHLSRDDTGDKPALLHLPLSFPHSSRSILTPWSTVSVHFPSLLPHFSDRSLMDDEEAIIGPGPNGTFSHVSYVKIHATCRLRRMWFSETGSHDQGVPWEFKLYG